VVLLQQQRGADLLDTLLVLAVDGPVRDDVVAMRCSALPDCLFPVLVKAGAGAAGAGLVLCAAVPAAVPAAVLAMRRRAGACDVAEVVVGRGGSPAAVEGCK
jgi:hypothetical protein